MGAAASPPGENAMEYQVATIYDDTDIEHQDEWERFRSLEEAHRYADLLHRSGLGAALFALPLADVPQVVPPMLHMVRLPSQLP
jgi:hypothetical protein